MPELVSPSLCIFLGMNVMQFKFFMMTQINVSKRSILLLQRYESSTEVETLNLNSQVFAETLKVTKPK